MSADNPKSDQPAAPNKGQQILALVQQLREALQVAAGGTDPQVQRVLEKIEAVLK